MSSSFLAKLLCERLKTEQTGCTFTSVGKAMKIMEENGYDLFLDAPQIRFCQAGNKIILAIKKQGVKRQEEAPFQLIDLKTDH